MANKKSEWTVAGGVEVVEQELMSKGQFGTVCMDRDDGGNKFYGYIYNNGYGASARIIRLGPSGEGRWVVECPPIEGIAHKADSVAILVAGADLEVAMSSHAVNEGARIMAIWTAKIVGVCVPPAPTGQPHDVPGPGSDKAYFLPNNPVTRGQAAKIIAHALSMQPVDVPQKFEDVPPGSPFYAEVQALADAGVIGGYRGHD